MSDDAGLEIARRDEMLELLFWLEGEGLQASANLSGMTRFLAHPETLVRATLSDLLERNYVVELGGASAEYRLTEVGRREASRWFKDEFSELLSQGHGECSDPDCDCHDNPGAAAECHAARSAGGHKH
ncbi:MAG: hypothetical protein ACR2G6_17850 [Gemmatimonadaceae bacterium]